MQPGERGFPSVLGTDFSSRTFKRRARCCTGVQAAIFQREQRQRDNAKRTILLNDLLVVSRERFIYDTDPFFQKERRLSMEIRFFSSFYI